MKSDEVMTAPDLAALSAAATQGPWKKGAKRNCDIDIIGKPTWPCTRYGKKGEWDVAVVTELDNVKEQKANAAFIVALVNEYRAGRLVQIDRADAAEAENVRLREAFRSIRFEAERENGSWVHIKRCIAVQSAQALGDEHGK